MDAGNVRGNVFSEEATVLREILTPKNPCGTLHSLQERRTEDYSESQDTIEMQVLPFKKGKEKCTNDHDDEAVDIEEG
jgi:hypothetical protein